MKIYKQIGPHVFDCNVCPTPCDAESKREYNFKTDVELSEFYEQKLISHINYKTNFKARKIQLKGWPDIEVKTKSGSLFYIEVKVQRRAFMSIKTHLPNSGLSASETVALNTSDLKHYFKHQQNHRKHIFIFWVLLDRPCVVFNNVEEYYYRLASELKPIYFAQKDKRSFVRKLGKGDVVDGERKGVILNFHFSLNELKKWKGSF